MEKIIPALRNAMNAGLSSVLITVIDSCGSVPRGAGASMLVLPDGSSAGTVGGGAIELSAAKAAADFLDARHGGVIKYSLDKNAADGIGMVCGGEARLHFRYISPSDGDTRTLAEGGKDRLCFEILPDGSGEFLFPDPDPALPAGPGTYLLQGREFYVQPLDKTERVLVFGGGHVSRALVPVLTSVGFRCTVSDDREGILSPEAFPNAERLITARFEGLMDSLDVTWRDYIVIMTYGHSGDLVLTRQALATPARYIGVLGSHTKAENAQTRLREEGFSEEQLSRVVCPIGLPIGGPTPEEIAISITAQMIAVRNGKQL